jgi:nucleotide-binding universal stress UspA family protein
VIKHILVPSDGSTTAMIGVDHGIEWARHYAAKLHALFVVDIKLLEGPLLRDISASLGTAPFVNYQSNITLLLEERGKAVLDDIRQRCEESGVDCETHLATGIIARTILEQAELADLIVMGRSGEHTEWLDGLVGSTTEAVVRRANQPVVVTGISEFKHEILLAAYDGSTHAKKALQIAADQASELDSELHVLIVGQRRVETYLEESRGYLESVDQNVHYETREGDPSEVIVEYAAESAADLLVMGAYGHTKVRELVVGSTTAYAMNHAPCPLLLVRP